MGPRGQGVGSQGVAVIEVEEPGGEGEAPETAGAAPRISIEDILPDSAPAPAPRGGAASGPERAAAGVRTARVLSVSGRRAAVALRGAPAPVEAEIAPEVDAELIADAHANGDLVLVELGGEGEAPLVVAALQTRRPREIRLRAATVHIEGDQEILLRSGRGAIRIREDGDIEVVGSRISAASRGLFRIVGRLLRLN